MNNPLNKQGEILERLTTGGRKLNEAECNICIGIDATSLRRGCLHSIDCVCNIRIGSDTSLGGEGLNCDETEIIWPHDFHILDDPQIHQSRKMTISKNSIKRSRTIKKEIED
ncbi:hypothetical protein KY284_008286 [Solanum tuberosum]|nr:hypothetical protein KY284_008286 [Solanum tuberosum]